MAWWVFGETLRSSAPDDQLGDLGLEAFAAHASVPWDEEPLGQAIAQANRTSTIGHLIDENTHGATCSPIVHGSAHAGPA